MKVMIALPGDKYFAVPQDVLAKYAVPKKQFEKDLAAKYKKKETVFHSEVEGQSDTEGQRLDPPQVPVLLGVRG